MEKRDNSGAVFVNERKERDSHPDRTGQAMVDGVEYYVSGWLKKDRNGKPYLSLAFKPKEQRSAAGDYERDGPIHGGRSPSTTMMCRSEP